MKYIAVFLACLVAAQAATFHCPSYEYWCAHSFHVLPERSYYCLTVPFDKCWLTPDYYKHEIISFPKKLVGGFEEEKDVDALVKDLEDKLKEAREKIKKDLMKGRTAYGENLEQLHKFYVSHFKQYYSYVVSDEAIVAKKVAEYEKELEQMHKRAMADYEKAVDAAILKIQYFHEQLISQFRQTVTTRDSRVKAYCTELESKATQYINSYKLRLDQIVLKKVAFVKKVFTILYSDKAMDDTFDDSMKCYEKLLKDEVTKLVAEFKVLVEQVTHKYKEAWRCSFIVTFTDGCYVIAKSMIRVNAQFPAAPHTACTFCGVTGYYADWAGCAYRDLKSKKDQKEDEEDCKFDEKKHLEEIQRLYVVYKQGLGSYKLKWEQQVKDWVISSKTGLEQILIKKMPATYDGCPPSQADITALHERLRKQAETWLKSQEHIQMSQVTSVCHQYEARIKSWERQAINLVKKVAENMKCCTDGMEKKIVIYKKCLTDKKTEQRECLKKMLESTSAKHMVQFNAFFVSVFGANPTNPKIVALKTHYKECIEKKVEEVLKKFDEWWILWEPKLIEHYCCGFKCKVKFVTPELHLNFEWNFCPADLRSCVFYC